VFVQESPGLILLRVPPGGSRFGTGVMSARLGTVSDCPALARWVIGGTPRHRNREAPVTTPFGGPARTAPGLPNTPTPPTGWPVGSYATYAEAQRAVDYLADRDFPVADVTLVGVDLMLVERVIGS